MPPGIEAAAPARVVSLNPCVDSTLMHVADPGQIAAISHYAHDPKATSIPLGPARRFRATSGNAEEVIALRPALVIVGRHVALATPHVLALRGCTLAERSEGDEDVSC